MTMNQSFRPFVGGLEHKMAFLAGNWAVGATGAVGAQVGGHGMSLTRNDVGDYTIQLEGADGTDTGVPYILYANAVLFNSDTNAGGDTDAHGIYCGATSATDGTFDFQCVDEAGAPAEAPSGAYIHVLVVVQLSALTV